MAVQQISVFLEHNTDGLMAFTEVLQMNALDIRAFSIAEARDFGIARVIVDDFDKAREVLKDAGYVTSVTPVLAVAIPDRAGGLFEVLSCFQEAGIHIKYTYAFTGHDKDMAYRVFHVEEQERAAEALTSKELHVINQEDLANQA